MWNIILALSIWGTWRYVWLVDKMHDAIVYKKYRAEVDEYFLQVFSDIRLDQNHTEDDYTTLLRALKLRIGRKRVQLFHVEEICHTVKHLDQHSNMLAWEIIETMMRMNIDDGGEYGDNPFILNSTLHDMITLVTMKWDSSASLNIALDVIGMLKSHQQQNYSEYVER